MPHFDVENRLREYLIASWRSYPKPIKGALTITLKSPLKLLITSSYNGQQLVFLENQIIFEKFHMPLSCHGNKLEGYKPLPWLEDNFRTKKFYH